MSNQYHYLVCGLPELATADFAAEKNLAQIQEDIVRNLTAEDRKLFAYLAYRNDNKNLLSLLDQEQGLTGSYLSFQTPAFYSHQELEEGLVGNTVLPEYMQVFLAEVDKSPEHMTGRRRANRLVELLYDEAVQQEDSFIRGYFQFKRDLKNIVGALNARLYDYPTAEVLIGDNDLILDLLNNKAEDFGVSQTYTFTAELKGLMAGQDFAALEKRIDELLIAEAEKLAGGDQFGRHAVFTYYLKLSKRARWLKIETERGRKELDKIIDGIIGSGSTPQEFMVSISQGYTQADSTG